MTSDGSKQASSALDQDAEVLAAEKAKRLAELAKAKAEAEKAEQEALAAKAKASQEAANAEREAASATDKILAENAKAAAEARKAEAETLAAVARAERDAANADRDAGMADEKSKAENDKAIAEARSSAVKAWLPTPTTKPLEGTTTTGPGTGTVGAVAAMQLLQNAAEKIALGVCSANATHVLVVDNVELAASDWAHAIVNTQITRLSAAASRVVTALRAEAAAPTRSTVVGTRFLPGVGAVATAVPALVGAAADVAGYFRSNYNIGKVDVTDTSTPLVAGVATALLQHDVVTHVDGLSLFGADAGTVRSFGKLLDARWDLLDVRLRTTQTGLEQAKDALAEATAARDQANAAVAQDQPPTGANEALVTAEQALSAARERVARVQGVVDSAIKLEELIDAQVTTMTTVATGHSIPPLGQAALRDLVHDPLRDMHVLAVSIDHIGADAIDRRSLFGRARVVYVGAAHVSAMLVAPGGNVVSSTTVATTSSTRLYLSTGTLAPKPRWVRSTTPDATVSVQSGATRRRYLRPAKDGDGAPRPIEPPRTTKTARWTLMVFMAGMNNLASEADKDIAEMVAASPGGDIEVVVFVKQPGGSRQFRVGGETEALGNVDSGDPNTVMGFVRWATAVAPAEKYALILWNHGTGWEPWAYDVDLPVGVRAINTPAGVKKVNSSVFTSTLAHMVPDPVLRQRAILTDDATAHAVDTIELGRLTKAIAEHLDRNLDVLAMDACLMSNLEVAYEVRDSVEVVVASEELEPGSGWDYTDFLTQLKQADDIDAESWGRLAVASYIDSYRGSGEQVTLSVIKTAGCQHLKDKLDELAESLASTMPLGRHRLTDALGESKRFAGHLVDLGQLCENLIALEGTSAGEPGGESVSAAAEVVRALLGADAGYVVAQDHDGDSVQGVSGVSVYLPARSDPFAPTYADLAFAEGQWDDMIQKFRIALTD